MNIVKNKKIIYYFLTPAFVVLFLILIFILSFEIAYAYKIYPRAYVGNIELTGKTKDQAVKYFTEKTDTLITNGLEFVWQDKNVNIDAVIAGSNASDVYEEIYSYDVRKTINQAYEYGHVGNWKTKLSNQFNALFKKNIIEPRFILNEKSLETILRDNFFELEKPAVNADLKISFNGNIAVADAQEEIFGQTFDYKKAITDAKNNILNLQKKDIVLQTIEDKPKIKKTDVEKIIPRAKEIIDLAPIIFTYGARSVQLSKAELASWLKLQKMENSTDENLDMELIINKEEAEKFLSIAAADIEIEPLDAKFNIVNDKVDQFQSSRNGLKLNIKKTFQGIKIKLLEEKSNAIELVVDQIEPKVKNVDVNDLGIVELIGRGISDFSGSTSNRIHNIANGAKKLNGLLIKPDEIFSITATLGDINGESGYLPELVIKGNSTTPEYGGGLCQIGTTTFRAALQSGLPILERRNHSYDVRYYSPTGTDATIYGPHPDVRFVNDTGRHILFLTSLEGTKLTFEFWGTKDGRNVKFAGKEETDDFAKLTPITYNIIKSGVPKYIETDTLPPGKKKIIEYSHRGVDAKFDYIVTYPSGEVKKETINSHYIPWREVWLIGKEVKEETVVEEEKIEEKIN
ncbi:MAG: VanW family protein [bacterium]